MFRVNALADARVADYLNEHFVCTYLKVGTFLIVGGQKVGGNVASYYCLGDGSVVHAVAGKVSADTLLNESRWATEIRKSAIMNATNLISGNIDMKKFSDKIQRAHAERYHKDGGGWSHGKYSPVPMQFPHHRGKQAQAHWLLARNPLGQLDTIYPVVWTRILNEQLSDAPVATR